MRKTDIEKKTESTLDKVVVDQEKIDELSARNLERAIKNHYLGGKAIYEYFGYFLP